MDDNTELLDWLIHRGFFPSFAFPLDLAQFNVTETVKRGRKPRARKKAGFSRDMMLALRELSPGNEITVNKYTYEIGGLHVEYPNHGPIDRLEGYFENIIVRHFNRCSDSNCNWVAPDTTSEKDGLCPVCEAAGFTNGIVSSPFFTPDGFAPIIYPTRYGRVAKNEQPNRGGYGYTMGPEDVSRGRSGDQPRPRVNLPSPSVEDEDQMEEVWVGGSEWSGTKVYSALPESQGTGTQLIVVNEGPMSEGFAFCKSCGTWDDKFDRDGTHHRPYPIDGETLSIYVNKLTDREKDDALRKAKRKCDDLASDRYMLGHVFRTDLIVIRFDLDHTPLIISNEINSKHFTGASLALKEAIITSAQRHLNLMNREISGGVRKVVRKTDNGWKRYLDVFLYDSVPGGAGLVTRLKDHQNLIPLILEDSIIRLGGDNCTNSVPCDRACTGCLLDFRNSIEHNILNRPLGLQLAEYFRNGTKPNPEFTALGVQQEIIANHVADLNNFFDGIQFTHDRGSIEIQHDGEVSRVDVYSPLARPQNDIPDFSDGKSILSQINYYQSREEISLYEVFDNDDWDI